MTTIADVVDLFGGAAGYVIVVGLSAARLWRLAGVDELTDGLRYWLASKSPGWARFVDFLSCPWCAGFWITFAVILAAPFIPIFVILLAAAQVTGMVGAWSTKAGE